MYALSLDQISKTWSEAEAEAEMESQAKGYSCEFIHTNQDGQINSLLR